MNHPTGKVTRILTRTPNTKSNAPLSDARDVMRYIIPKAEHVCTGRSRLQAILGCIAWCSATALVPIDADEPQPQMQSRSEGLFHLPRHPGLVVPRHILDGGLVDPLAVLGGGEVGVRADAAVGEAAAGMLGIGEGAVGGGFGLHRPLLHGLRGGG